MGDGCIMYIVFVWMIGYLVKLLFVWLWLIWKNKIIGRVKFMYFYEMFF